MGDREIVLVPLGSFTLAGAESSYHFDQSQPPEAGALGVNGHSVWGHSGETPPVHERLDRLRGDLSLRWQAAHIALARALLKDTLIVGRGYRIHGCGKRDKEEGYPFLPVSG